MAFTPAVRQAQSPRINMPRLPENINAPMWRSMEDASDSPSGFAGYRKHREAPTKTRKKKTLLWRELSGEERQRRLRAAQRRFRAKESREGK